MRLDTLAWLGLKRKKARTLWLLFTLAVTVGTLLFLYIVATAMNQELANAFDAVGANIVVFPAGNQSLAYGGVAVAGDAEAYLRNDDVIAINSIPNRKNVAYIAPKVIGMARVDFPPGSMPPARQPPTAISQQVLLVGVDFPAELALKKWWRLSGREPEAVDDLLVGAKVAADLGLTPGKRLTLQGREFRVAGVLASQGNEDDEAIFAQLLAVQEVLGRQGRLSLIEVAAYCTTCPIEQIMAQIREKLPGARVTALADAVRARQAVVDGFNRLAVAVGVTVAVVGGLVVLLLVMAAVKERTREIGLYRAMGYRRAHILEIILTEVLLVGLAGGAMAYLGGTWLAGWLGPGVTGVSLGANWDPLLGGMTVLITAGIGVLAGAYPAVQAARLDPARALRFI
ncbi:MAG: ABC transporter permease [Clostridia bacterium]|nr:MAG: ABC transporter permease [Clostridia bacterium]